MPEFILLHGFSPWDADARVARVELPPGYRRVWRGWVKPGDLCLSRSILQTGQVEWIKARWRMDAECYTCLIRQDAPVDTPCKMCAVNRALIGQHYCRSCRKEVIHQE